MGVTKSAQEKDLKRAFKKRALKVHPDQNSAPQATEAFKKVNAAMTCLSDPQKRRVYDQVGNEEAFTRRESQSGGNAGRNPFAGHGFGGHAEFFDAEDIFNHFFFGAEMPRGN